MTPEYWHSLMDMLGDPTLPMSKVKYNRLQRAYEHAGEKEPLGCGLSKLFWTGLNDPFLPAGCWHDLMHPMRYGASAGYVMHDRTEKEVDDEFNWINGKILKRIGPQRPWWYLMRGPYYGLVKLYRANFVMSPDVNYHYILPSEKYKIMS